MRRSQAHIEGLIRPLLPIAWLTRQTKRGGSPCTTRRTPWGRRTDFDFLFGSLERPQPLPARAAGGLGRVGGVRRPTQRRAPAARRPRQRGRVPHRPRRRHDRHVVPLLRRRCRRSGRSTGPTAAAAACSTRPSSARSPTASGSSRATDTFDGRPILVRFTWSRIDTPDAALGAGVLGRRRRDVGAQLDHGLHARGGRRDERARRRSARSAPSYEHVSKVVHPAPVVEAGGGAAQVVRHRRGRAADPARRSRRWPREALDARPPRRESLAGELGFVILHRCGDELLLPPRLDLAQRERALGDRLGQGGERRAGLRAVAARRRGHHPTFCVWELRAVCHEPVAWSRYLRSGARRAREARVPRGHLHRARRESRER